MQRKIFIEPETMKRAEENTREALNDAGRIMETGSPEEIREAVRRVLEASQAQRAFIRTNYNI